MPFDQKKAAGEGNSTLCPTLKDSFQHFFKYLTAGTIGWFID